MSEAKRIRSREEIPAEDKWSIEDLYATDADWEADLKSVAEDQEYLSSFAGKLAEKAEYLCDYLRRLDLSACREIYLLHLSDATSHEGHFINKVSRAVPPHIQVTACPK